MKHIEETWTIGIDEIKGFIEAQPGIICDGGDVYMSGKCRIELFEAPDHMLGGMKLKRTRIVLSGDDADLESFHRRFVLQFMSAGG